MIYVCHSFQHGVFKRMNSFPKFNSNFDDLFHKIWPYDAKIEPFLGVCIFVS